jgi:hypothetical protein
LIVVEHRRKKTNETQSPWLRVVALPDLIPAAGTKCERLSVVGRQNDYFWFIHHCMFLGKLTPKQKYRIALDILLIIEVGLFIVFIVILALVLFGVTK